MDFFFFNVAYIRSTPYNNKVALSITIGYKHRSGKRQAGGWIETLRNVKKAQLGFGRFLFSLYYSVLPELLSSTEYVGVCVCVSVGTEYT